MRDGARGSARPSHNVATAGSIVLLLFLVTDTLTTLPLYAYEHVMYAIAPSAERAYAYGTRHFNARNPADYDIGRAEYFFQQALRRNPRYPLVQHQIGRIDFLKGDFARALARMDLELSGNPDPSPSTYYMRGLIQGFMGAYGEAAKDYERYLELDPSNWAALNDYAWVLLKANRPDDAAWATERGLAFFPENAWLLNTSAIALFEVGDMDLALERAKAAVAASDLLSRADWLTAYPGNDPKVAAEGVESLREASRANMHRIAKSVALRAVQSQ